MNWISYFDHFFTQRATQVETILDAAGCREGWVQGEAFLHGQDLPLKTNATCSKFDLFCPDPPMIAEIKICGGDYARKMRGFVQDDVRKLSRAPGQYDRFMILIVDNRTPHTHLGQWLTTCRFPHIRKHEKRVANNVIIRIWQIRESLGGNSDKAADGLTGAPQG